MTRPELKTFEEQITVVQREIEGLKGEIKQLQTENMKISQQLEAIFNEIAPIDSEKTSGKLDECDMIEVGLVTGAPIKGKLNWIDNYVISILTEEENSEEIILYKHAIAYIRKSSENRRFEDNGMYL